MQMTQVTQRGPILFAHAPGKLRIIQSLIARGLRHVLKPAQTLLNRLPAVRRHLSPLWQHVILDVVALRLCHLVPDLPTLPQFLTLCWRKVL